MGVKGGGVYGVGVGCKETRGVWGVKRGGVYGDEVKGKGSMSWWQEG